MFAVMTSPNRSVGKIPICAILTLCAMYCVFQYFYIPYPLFGVDEFWFAHHIYQYTHSVPYKDFPPYKSVLGYYLLSIPYYFTQGLWQPLLNIRYEVALINTCMLAAISLWASRLFAPRAIILTLLLIICNQLFLVYSTELRVDMLSSWFCLASALVLLNNRLRLSGILLGLGFLVSQKAIWYIAASNGAIVIYGLAVLNHSQTSKTLLKFNGALLAVIAAYVLFWGMFSSVHEVLRSLFYEAYTQNKITVYAVDDSSYWQLLLTAGPLLLLLLPLTFLNLFARNVTAEQNRRCLFTTAYGFIAILAMVVYQQFFPYNTVFLVPAFFLLYAQFFSWWLQGNLQLDLTPRQLWIAGLIYSIAIGAMLALFALPGLNYIIMLVPLACCLILTGNHKQLGWLGLSITLLITGVIYPMVRLPGFIKNIPGDYQKSMLQMASELTAQGESYVAGVLIFYNRDQTVPGLKNLIAPARRYLETPQPELLPALLPSLNISPATPTSVIQSLQDYPVKIYINSYRMENLPAPVLSYLAKQFEHYWGSIYIYAPTIAAGAPTFALKFTARYVLQAANPVIIDGQIVKPETTIKLTAGTHQAVARQDFRLKLQPDNIHMALNPDFKDNRPDGFVRGLVV